MPHPFPEGGEGSSDPKKNNPEPVPEDTTKTTDSFPSNGNGDQSIESEQDDGFSETEKTGLNLSADADLEEKTDQPKKPDNGNGVVHDVEIVDDSKSGDQKSKNGETEKKRSSYRDAFLKEDTEDKSKSGSDSNTGEAKQEAGVEKTSGKSDSVDPALEERKRLLRDAFINGSTGKPKTGEEIARSLKDIGEIRIDDLSDDDREDLKESIPEVADYVEFEPTTWDKIKDNPVLLALMAVGGYQVIKHGGKYVMNRVRDKSDAARQREAAGNETAPLIDEVKRKEAGKPDVILKPEARVKVGSDSRVILSNPQGKTASESNLTLSKDAHGKVEDSRYKELEIQGDKNKYRVDYETNKAFVQKGDKLYETDKIEVLTEAQFEKQSARIDSLTNPENTKAAVELLAVSEGGERGLKKAANAITDKAGLPEAKLVGADKESLKAKNAEAYYRRGTGEVVVPKEVLSGSSSAYSARDNSEFTKLFLHEVTHLEQDTLMVRKVADDLKVGKGFESDSQRESLQQEYKRRTGVELSSQFADKVIESRDGKVLTSAEASRADRLFGDSHSSEIVNRSRTLRKIDAVDGALKGIEDGKSVTEILKKFNPERNGFNFGEKLPKEIAGWIEKAHAGEELSKVDGWNEGANKAKLKEFLTERSSELFQNKRDNYLDSLTEREANKVGNTAALEVQRFTRYGNGNTESGRQAIDVGTRMLEPATQKQVVTDIAEAAKGADTTSKEATGRDLARGLREALLKHSLGDSKVLPESFQNMQVRVGDYNRPSLTYIDKGDGTKPYFQMTVPESSLKTEHGRTNLAANMYGSAYQMLEHVAEYGEPKGSSESRIHRMNKSHYVEALTVSAETNTADYKGEIRGRPEKAFDLLIDLSKSNVNPEMLPANVRRGLRGSFNYISSLRPVDVANQMNRVLNSSNPEKALQILDKSGLGTHLFGDDAKFDTVESARKTLQEYTDASKKTSAADTISRGFREHLRTNSNRELGGELNFVKPLAEAINESGFDGKPESLPDLIKSVREKSNSFSGDRTALRELTRYLEIKQTESSIFSGDKNARSQTQTPELVGRLESGKPVLLWEAKSAEQNFENIKAPKDFKPRESGNGYDYVPVEVDGKVKRFYISQETGKAYEYSPRPVISGRLVETDASRRIEVGHSKNLETYRAPLNPTEKDIERVNEKVNELLKPLREKIKAGEKVDSVTRQSYYDKAAEVMLPHAKRMAQRQGLSPDTITRNSFSFGEVGGESVFSPGKGQIVIDINSEKPFNASETEVKNMAQSLETRSPGAEKGESAQNRSFESTIDLNETTRRTIESMPGKTLEEKVENSRKRFDTNKDTKFDRNQWREHSKLIDQTNKEFRELEINTERTAEQQTRFESLQKTLQTERDFRSELVKNLELKPGEINAWATAGAANRGGDFTQGFVYRKLNEMMNEHSNALGGKPKDKGFVVVPVTQNTGMDGKGMDIILLNTKTGDFVFLDATSNPAKLKENARTAMHQDGVIFIDSELDKKHNGEELKRDGIQRDLEKNFERFVKPNARTVDTITGKRRPLSGTLNIADVDIVNDLKVDPPKAGPQSGEADYRETKRAEIETNHQKLKKLIAEAKGNEAKLTPLHDALAMNAREAERFRNELDPVRESEQRLVEQIQKSAKHYRELAKLAASPIQQEELRNRADQMDQFSKKGTNTDAVHKSANSIVRDTERYFQEREQGIEKAKLEEARKVRSAVDAVTRDLSARELERVSRAWDLAENVKDSKTSGIAAGDVELVLEEFKKSLSGEQTSKFDLSPKAKVNPLTVNLKVEFSDNVKTPTVEHSLINGKERTPLDVLGVNEGKVAVESGDKVFELSPDSVETKIRIPDSYRTDPAKRAQLNRILYEQMARIEARASSAGKPEGTSFEQLINNKDARSKMSEAQDTISREAGARYTESIVSEGNVKEIKNALAKSTTDKAGELNSIVKKISEQRTANGETLSFEQRKSIAESTLKEVQAELNSKGLKVESRVVSDAGSESLKVELSIAAADGKGKVELSSETVEPKYTGEAQSAEGAKPGEPGFVNQQLEKIVDQYIDKLAEPASKAVKQAFSMRTSSNKVNGINRALNGLLPGANQSGAEAMDLDTRVRVAEKTMKNLTSELKAKGIDAEFHVGRNLKTKALEVELRVTAPDKSQVMIFAAGAEKPSIQKLDGRGNIQGTPVEAQAAEIADINKHLGEVADKLNAKPVEEKPLEKRDTKPPESREKVVEQTATKPADVNANKEQIKFADKFYGEGTLKDYAGKAQGFLRASQADYLAVTPEHFSEQFVKPFIQGNELLKGDALFSKLNLVAGESSEPRLVFRDSKGTEFKPLSRYTNDKGVDQFVLEGGKRIPVSETTIEAQLSKAQFDQIQNPTGDGKPGKLRGNAIRTLQSQFASVMGQLHNVSTREARLKEGLGEAKFNSLTRGQLEAELSVVREGDTKYAEKASQEVLKEVSRKSSGLDTLTGEREAYVDKGLVKTSESEVKTNAKVQDTFAKLKTYADGRVFKSNREQYNADLSAIKELYEKSPGFRQQIHGDIESLAGQKPKALFATLENIRKQVEAREAVEANRPLQTVEEGKPSETPERKVVQVSDLNEAGRKQYEQLKGEFAKDPMKLFELARNAGTESDGKNNRDIVRLAVEQTKFSPEQIRDGLAKAIASENPGRALSYLEKTAEGILPANKDFFYEALAAAKQKNQLNSELSARSFLAENAPEFGLPKTENAERSYPAEKGINVYESGGLPRHVTGPEGLAIDIEIKPKPKLSAGQVTRGEVSLQYNDGRSIKGKDIVFEKSTGEFSGKWIVHANDGTAYEWNGKIKVGTAETGGTLETINTDPASSEKARGERPYNYLEGKDPKSGQKITKYIYRGHSPFEAPDRFDYQGTKYIHTREIVDKAKYTETQANKLADRIAETVGTMNGDPNKLRELVGKFNEISSLADSKDYERIQENMAKRINAKLNDPGIEVRIKLNRAETIRIVNKRTNNQIVIGGTDNAKPVVISANKDVSADSGTTDRDGRRLNARDSGYQTEMLKFKLDVLEPGTKLDAESLNKLYESNPERFMEIARSLDAKDWKVAEFDRAIERIIEKDPARSAVFAAELDSKVFAESKTLQKVNSKYGKILDVASGLGKWHSQVVMNPLLQGILNNTDPTTGKPLPADQQLSRAERVEALRFLKEANLLERVALNGDFSSLEAAQKTVDHYVGELNKQGSGDTTLLPGEELPNRADRKPDDRDTKVEAPPKSESEKRIEASRERTRRRNMYEGFAESLSGDNQKIARAAAKGLEYSDMREGVKAEFGNNGEPLNLEAKAVEQKIIREATSLGLGEEAIKQAIATYKDVQDKGFEQWSKEVESELTKRGQDVVSREGTEIKGVNLKTQIDRLTALEGKYKFAVSGLEIQGNLGLANTGEQRALRAESQKLVGDAAKALKSYFNGAENSTELAEIAKRAKVKASGFEENSKGQKFFSDLAEVLEKNSESQKIESTQIKQLSEGLKQGNFAKVKASMDKLISQWGDRPVDGEFAKRVEAVAKSANANVKVRMQIMDGARTGVDGPKYMMEIPGKGVDLVITGSKDSVASERASETAAYIKEGTEVRYVEIKDSGNSPLIESFERNYPKVEVGVTGDANLESHSKHSDSPFNRPEVIKEMMSELSNLKTSEADVESLRDFEAGKRRTALKAKELHTKIAKALGQSESMFELNDRLYVKEQLKEKPQLLAEYESFVNDTKKFSTLEEFAKSKGDVGLADRVKAQEAKIQEIVNKHTDKLGLPRMKVQVVPNQNSYAEYKTGSGIVTVNPSVAMALSNNHSEALRNISTVIHEPGHGEQEAKALKETLLSMNPEDARDFNKVAEAYKQKTEVALDREFFERALPALDKMELTESERIRARQLQDSFKQHQLSQKRVSQLRNYTGEIFNARSNLNEDGIKELIREAESNGKLREALFENGANPKEIQDVVEKLNSKEFNSKEAVEVYRKYFDQRQSGINAEFNSLYHNDTHELEMQRLSRQVEVNGLEAKVDSTETNRKHLEVGKRYSEADSVQKIVESTRKNIDPAALDKMEPAKKAEHIQEAVRKALRESFGDKVPEAASRLKISISSGELAEPSRLYRTVDGGREINVRVTEAMLSTPEGISKVIAEAHASVYETSMMELKGTVPGGQNPEIPKNNSNSSISTEISEQLSPSKYRERLGIAGGDRQNQPLASANEIESGKEHALARVQVEADLEAARNTIDVTRSFVSPENQAEFEKFSRSIDQWRAASRELDALQRERLSINQVKVYDLPEHKRDEFRKQDAKKQKRLAQLEKDVPEMRRQLESQAQNLSDSQFEQFDKEFKRQSLLEQMRIAGEWKAHEAEYNKAAAEARKISPDLQPQMDHKGARFRRQLKDAVEKQSEQFDILRGPKPPKPEPIDPTKDAADNPEAKPRDRLKDISRKQFDLKQVLEGPDSAAEQLKQLKAKNSVSQWWNRKLISNLEKQVSEAQTESTRLTKLEAQVRQKPIADMKVGDTFTIGRRGEIPFLDTRLRSQHAQIKRLGNGTFAITDGFEGRSSNFGMGEEGRPLKNYGTYVERIGPDGLSSFKKVDVSKPTIVKPGDIIHIGHNPELGRESGALKIEIPASNNNDVSTQGNPFNATVREATKANLIKSLVELTESFKPQEKSADSTKYDAMKKVTSEVTEKLLGTDYEATRENLKHLSESLSQKAKAGNLSQAEAEAYQSTAESVDKMRARLVELETKAESIPGKVVEKGAPLTVDGREGKVSLVEGNLIVTTAEKGALTETGNGINLEVGDGKDLRVEKGSGIQKKYELDSNRFKPIEIAESGNKYFVDIGAEGAKGKPVDLSQVKVYRAEYNRRGEPIQLHEVDTKNKIDILEWKDVVEPIVAERSKADGNEFKSREGSIKAMKVGDTSTIGRMGTISVDADVLSRRHASLTRNADGSYDLLNLSSKSTDAMGDTVKLKNRFGTFVERKSGDGKVTYEQVSSEKATKVRPGDVIYVGSHPQSDGTKVRIEIPKPPGAKAEANASMGYALEPMEQLNERRMESPGIEREVLPERERIIEKPLTEAEKAKVKSPMNQRAMQNFAKLIELKMRIKDPVERMRAVQDIAIKSATRIPASSATRGLINSASIVTADLPAGQSKMVIRELVANELQRQPIDVKSIEGNQVVLNDGRKVSIENCQVEIQISKESSGKDVAKQLLVRVAELVNKVDPRYEAESPRVKAEKLNKMALEFDSVFNSERESGRSRVTELAAKMEQFNLREHSPVRMTKYGITIGSQRMHFSELASEKRRFLEDRQKELKNRERNSETKEIDAKELVSIESELKELEKIQRDITPERRLSTAQAEKLWKIGERTYETVRQERGKIAERQAKEGKAGEGRATKAINVVGNYVLVFTTVAGVLFVGSMASGNDSGSLNTEFVPLGGGA